jgi:sigma-B regulation protein RsbU (phosphoserine phosphatase)
MLRSVLLLAQVPVGLTRAQLRDDLLNIAIFVLLFTVALAAIALFFLRRKSRDLTLIYFGLFCILYSVRLLTPLRTVRAAFGVPPAFWVRLSWIITFTILVPAGLFLYQVVGQRVRAFLRWVLLIQAVCGILGISAMFAGTKLEKLNIANNTMVLATFTVTGIFVLAIRLRQASRQPLSHEMRTLIGGFLVFFAFILHTNLAQLRLVPGGNVEVLGFLVFVGCLGYVAAHRTFANEERLLAINNELEIARQIQSSTLPREVPRLAGVQIAARYVPMSAVAGDFYDFLPIDDRHIGVLIADVTGHGVPAALIASMLKVAFAGQTECAADPARVLTGLNRALCGKFEDHFITAAYVFLDLDTDVMRYAGAGHPPLMLATTHCSATVRQIEQNGLMLGLFPEAAYSAIEIPFRAGDRCLLYTDGVVEAVNAAHEEFGKPRLEQILAQHATLAPDRFIATLLDEISRWSSQAGGQRQDDDITLLVLDFHRSPQAGA